MHFRVRFTFKVEECGEINRAALKGRISIQKIEQQSETEQFEGSENVTTHSSPGVCLLGKRHNVQQVSLSRTDTRAKDFEVCVQRGKMSKKIPER